MPFGLCRKHNQKKKLKNKDSAYLHHHQDASSSSSDASAAPKRSYTTSSGLAYARNPSRSPSSSSHHLHSNNGIACPHHALVSHLTIGSATTSRSLSTVRAFTTTNTVAAAATAAAEAAPAPALPATTATDVSPAIKELVDRIAGLSLLETASLVEALKTKLGITAIAMPMAPGPAAAGSAGSAGAADADGGEDAAPAKAAAAAKTEFKVKLEKFAADAKAKVIREMKALLPGANLVEAKKFVEAAPKMIKENATKEEAEKMKKVLEAVGATVTIE